MGKVTQHAPEGRTPTTLHAADPNDSPWWHDAVIYQIYPRSWADSDGDGIGDLKGITDRLPYLRDLGVDAVWLSPFYVSPMHDAGYDVANYRDIDPLFGSLADADALIARAHDLGLKIIVDLVPNHSSSEHEWFRAALKAGPGSPERARYVFREGKGEQGEKPPNNWPSVFGGNGWTRVTEEDGNPGEWYLHIFDTTQPDYDWTNPEVGDEFASILQFWCDRGVDGFRVDVAHGLIKEEGLPDWDGPLLMLDATDHNPNAALPPDVEAQDVTARVHEAGPGGRPPMWDQEGVHEIYRRWRSLLDEQPSPARILCAEAWVKPTERLARYVRPDEMHQAFNFDFLDTHWDAAKLQSVIEHSFRHNDAVGAPTTWVLSNHDVVRHASRLGLDQSLPRPNGIAADQAQPDAELGLRRARAATMLMLGLPGSAYIYQGEELGLPESTDMPHEFRQDPTFHRTEGKEIGRDGCRVPMPWVKDAPSLGFGPGVATWLPQPESYGAFAVDQQAGVDGSTLELYRSMLTARRADRLGLGSATWHELSSRDVVAFVNAAHDDSRRTLVLVNLGAEPVALPDGAVVTHRSGELDGDGLIPTDVAIWARI
ncbi:alpha-glucosidase [Knoellia sinensis KCTC 19936]|uniref:Alpha-glucosidase n=1 Tax=Knoellia sinensis KCTC 19936 TaxID=1385520 RepID=A0A0A0JGK9_9MICO|nr:glycoside hydrolase family 13 protein [Knoellia sinensis]KGN34761.1 alpha-glucosidase [Knoellia sinensis KCTC 19936]